MSKTKIVATIGPACDSEEMLKELIKTGVSVIRFNTKHNSLEWHEERIYRVRKVSGELKKPVAILLDLKGPELRVAKFPGGQIELRLGEIVYFSDKPTNKTQKTIVVDGLKQVKDLKPGGTIYLDDGFLEAEIIKVLDQGSRVSTRVIEAGVLKDMKGVNFPAFSVDLPSLVKKDLEFISMKAREEIDYFGYSFVRNKKDVQQLRQVITKQRLKTKIIAKIEREQALANFDEILAEADGIMIARGDLGVEIPLEQVPFFQRMIIRKCREAGKPVIVATQMLESMVQKPRPTRAEANDVANAVYEATDAVMLSGETASGLFPLKSVQVMQRICEFIENKQEVPEIIIQFNHLGEMITFSAFKMVESKVLGEILNRLKIASFVVFTDTGATARYLARLRPHMPILVLTEDCQVRDQLCLVYNVLPFCHRFPEGEIRSTKYGLQFLKNRGMLKKGERVLTIYGKQWGVPGETNTIRVEEVG